MGGPQEIAKEVIRLVATAGVKKDVIDLLEKKVALLTEQITTLETQNLNLKQKVYDLEQELDRLRPQQDRLEKERKNSFNFFPNHRDQAWSKPREDLV